MLSPVDAMSRTRAALVGQSPSPSSSPAVDPQTPHRAAELQLFKSHGPSRGVYRSLSRCQRFAPHDAEPQYAAHDTSSFAGALFSSELPLPVYTLTSRHVATRPHCIFLFIGLLSSPSIALVRVLVRHVN